MEDVVRPIRLYGSLGAKFGRDHAYVVRSPRDAVRALSTMVPGFWQELVKSGQRGVRYAVFVGQRNVDKTQLDWPSGGEPIRIAPVIAGSKAGGIFQTIAGVALAAAGAASMWLIPSNKFGIDMMLMGGSLALGGIAQMLSPQTPTPSPVSQHGMPGIQNVVAQGGPVPLLYGRMRVGSTVISADIQAIDAPARAAEQDIAPVATQTSGGIEGQEKTVINSRLCCTIVDLISEGEIEGLANNVGPFPAKAVQRRSVYLDGVRVENDDGSLNFEVEKFDFVEGKAQQDAIKWVTAASSEVQVGVELQRRLADAFKDGKKIKVTQFTPCKIEVAEPDVDEVDVTVQVNDLWWDSNKGHTNATIKLQFAPSYDPARKNVPAPKVETKEITGICQSYSKTFTFPVELVGGARFVLEISRADEIDQDKSVGKKHGTAHVVSYTKKRTGEFKYPASAVAAMRITSDKFDRIPVRSYDVKGLLVEVPDNYDPVGRKYGKEWTGKFKRAWTDNPAWIFRDLLLNGRYGAGAWLRDSHVDRFALYAIAKYCDEEVPSSGGGTEPRFTCNCYITTRSHAFALLQQLASVFRGIAYWSAGSVLTSADMPCDPAYIYNPSNVVEGVFKYTGSALKSRYTAVMVTWCDPNNGFQRAVESVEDLDGIALYGYNTAEITAFGCTSRSQAQRAGHWLLETSRLETDTVTFGVGLDGALALPGQVIEIADPLRSQRSIGGRIKAVTDTGRVILDREVEALPGSYLTLMMPDASIHRVGIESVHGTEVMPSGPLPKTPVRGAAWTIQPAAEVRQLYRVVGVSESHDGTSFTITATRHAPEKFALVDNAAATDKTDQAYVPIAAPSALRLEAFADYGARMSAKISWGAVASAKQHLIEWHESGHEVKKERLANTKCEWVVHDLKPGNYTARVQAEVWDGRLSEVAEVSRTLNGLVSIKDLRLGRDRRALIIDCELEGATNTLQWRVEVRLGETDKFADARGNLYGEIGSARMRVAERRSGYCWVRAIYAIPSPSGDFNSRHSSAWFPSEAGPGMRYEKD
ncbi:MULTISPECIES: phage tail protein [unclassified Caballeronia]|uniref:phage tail protein n=1 Tax=unclassified Caballeronia TaxID=2646786 RepID=UPI0020297D95|nr:MULTISPECIES: phage tail protein [unclassified Caballeronia]